MIKSISLLVNNIRWLGLIKGFQYWIIARKIRDNKDILLKWAADFRRTAITAENKEFFLSWAEELELAHELIKQDKK